MNKIKEILSGSIGFYVALFFVLSLTAWFSNAVYGTKFVLSELRDIFVWIFGQLSIKHGIDSALNSPRGTSPN